LTKYRFRNITVSLALAALGALLVGLYVVSYRRGVDNGVETVPVLVAARDIPEGTAGPAVASGGYLRTAHVLRRTVVPGAISRGSDLGSVVAGSTIYEGQQVTVRQFKPLVEGGIFAKFSGSQRAMLVPGDGNQILAGTVADGDHVDVIANVKYSVGGKARVATRTVLSDLLVLRAPTSSSASGLGGTGATESIALALTTNQAQRLLFALKNSDWWLVLRPAAHPKTASATVMTLEQFLGGDLGAQGIFQLTGGTSAGAISGQ
jgi:Flp pilus assembly protein CpaB